MGILSFVLTFIGLSIFEVVTSVDNAIINAEVLSGMTARARKWFLLWGYLFAVIVIRGLVPFIIVWAANPHIGPIGVLTAAFSRDPLVTEAIERSSPMLLLAGGVFLLFLFFHWLFLEPKNFGLRGERFFHAQGTWFYGTVAIFLCLIVGFGLRINPALGIAAMI